MNKRIGIISFHSDPNYGTMYQAYALAKAISNLGGKPEYILYEPVSYRSPIKSKFIFITKWLLSMIGIYKAPTTEYSFLRTKDFRNLKKKYNAFHDKYIPVSKNIYYSDTVYEAIKEYDYFIVGSDQTWSPSCNVNPNTPNFLNFVKDNNKKRSYAPSIGTVHINSDYLSKLIKELSTFKYLSCREYYNSIMLSKKLDNQVRHVLDPTLLIDVKEWELIEKPVVMPEKFILCYILGTKECISDYAEMLGKAKKLPVYYMVTRPEYFSKPNKLVDISPEQFLWLLHHSSYVVTDSFHGCMFSINYNRNFYSFAKRVTNNTTQLDNDRIMDFLSFIGLQNRFINDNETRMEDDIDYSVINKQLSVARNSSINYLSTIITD